MRRSGALAFVAALAAGLATAQSVTTTLSAGTTYQPTVPWTIAGGPSPTTGACSAGAVQTAGPAGYYGGGVYTDKYGDFWEMDCDYSFSSTTYYDGTFVGTNALGVVACFNGCAGRIQCVGFSYYGNAFGNSSGSGRCFHFYTGQQGTLAYTPGQLIAGYASPLYGSGYLLQKNSAAFFCPTQNNTYYTDASGKFYYILCGYDVTNGGSGVVNGGPSGAVPNMQQCMINCDAAGAAGCTSFSYKYAGAEVNGGTSGTCYYHIGGIPLAVNPATLAYASQVTAIPSSVSGQIAEMILSRADNGLECGSARDYHDYHYYYTYHHYDYCALALLAIFNVMLLTEAND
ncbi:hypothetical protein LTR10_006827 [Elasticomyces elasticus]|nr:hypothetical protein LTR10_006827 [Elasticomyces elasticus]